MSEIAREHLAVADTAKATFLANISHELRSPLHGILGSIEFLHDTATDDFQSAMLISVETCGKTLLDTVNHVLDYAKINNLSSKPSKLLGHPSNRDGRHASSSESSLTEAFDLASIVEEAIEAVYVGQVFRTASVDAINHGGPTQSSFGRAIEARHSIKENIKEGVDDQKSSVHLTVNIRHHDNWRVVSQPGAIRRVVMNLLGNSLKYTDNGSVSVSLEVTPEHHAHSPKLPVCITVTDTGRGMSEEFISNHAFTAFSQEDSLSMGTGLGLSIIRQIVDSLGGRITLESLKDVGTEIRVWLSLPVGPPNDGNDEYHDVLRLVQDRVQKLTVCFLEPVLRREHQKAPFQSIRDMPSVGSALRDVFAQWFDMHVFAAANMDGVKADVFIYAEPPPIEYLMDHHGNHALDREVPVIILCTNAFESASLRTNGIHQLTEIGRIIEIIPQPLGPQKLAKVLLRCLKRVEQLEKGDGHGPGDVQPTIPQAGGAAQEDDHKGNQGVGTVQPSIKPELHERKKGSSVQESPVEERSQERAEEHKTGMEPDLEYDGSEHGGSRHENGDNNSSYFTAGASTDNNTTTAPTTPMFESPQPKKASHGGRVLVVDDNPINLQLLVLFVRKANRPYDSACDGLQALEAYKRSCSSDDPEERFEHIFMDISMPVMDGMQSAREIRRFESENNIQQPVKIIALTGLGSKDAQDQAARVGFDEFITKPIKFKELRHMLV